MYSRSAIDSLRYGEIKTDKNRVKDFTILLVGETGVGKTSFLSLLANVLAGNEPEQYEDYYDDLNESGMSTKHSQTNEARVYEIRSKNNVIIRVLDSPGLADTRGLERDELHKRSIAEAIKNYITTVDAVLILANGTVPRLTTGLDYALSTLSAIFPNTLAKNIGFLFTNVSSPLSWNFDEESLPESLRGNIRLLLDNPAAVQKKYLKLKADPKISQREKEKMRRIVCRTEEAALEMLAEMFDWLDSLTPQPTRDILSLYEQSQIIEMEITNILARMHQVTLKDKDLDKVKQELEKASVDMNTYKNYEDVIRKKVWVQNSTSRHNTVCISRDCYHNCHISCGLIYTLNPIWLWGCRVMEAFSAKCRVCHHPCGEHRHFRTLWKQEEQDEHAVDEQAKKNFNAAKSSKEKAEILQKEIEKSKKRIQVQIEGGTEELGLLIESYSNLSLSGSFTAQVEKAVTMLEQNLEAMRQGHATRETIAKMELSLKCLRDKLELLKKLKRSVMHSTADALNRRLMMIGFH